MLEYKSKQLELDQTLFTVSEYTVYSIYPWFQNFLSHGALSIEEFITEYMI